MENSINKKRVYAFDNLKFFLILVVVIGHTITSDINENSILRSVFIFIYSFHMPLFIFISGLFQKKEQNSLNYNKILEFTFLGLILKMGIMFFHGVLFNGTPNFSLLSGDGVFWYLFAVASYIVICYLLRNVNISFVFYISILLALLVGYDKTIGDFLCLSRIIVFFPFYYAGFCLNPQKVLESLNKRWIKILSVILILVWLYLVITQLDLVYPFRMLFTGRHPYANVKIENCTMFHRLLTTTISAILCIAFISIIPSKKIPLISSIGTKTLQIYFWHGFILRILRYLGVFVYIERAFPDECWILFSIISLLIVLLLSLDIFGKPIKAIINCIDTKKDRKLLN